MKKEFSDLKMRVRKIETENKKINKKIEALEKTTRLNRFNNFFVREIINGVSMGLQDREKAILFYRHSIKNKEIHTLEETSKEFGLTKERIRQIEEKALMKIKYRLKRMC